MILGKQSWRKGNGLASKMFVIHLQLMHSREQAAQSYVFTQSKSQLCPDQYSCAKWAADPGLCT